MAAWPVRRWLVALAAGVAAALLTGIPTGMVETSLFTRMTPVTWWNYPVWAVSSVLAGLIAATYVRAGAGAGAVEPEAADRSRSTAAATVVSALAVGCPVCNKLVVAAIGTSGALSFWAPIQPILGVLSIAVLVAALAVRLRGPGGCALPSAEPLTART